MIVIIVIIIIIDIIRDNKITSIDLYKHTMSPLLLALLTLQKAIFKCALVTRNA